MNKKKTKFNFVSDEWVDQAEIILNDLVSQFGVEGVSFSVCETFFDAPTVALPHGIFILMVSQFEWGKAR